VPGHAHETLADFPARAFGDGGVVVNIH